MTAFGPSATWQRSRPSTPAPMRPAIKRPVRPAALDVGNKILAQGCGAQERAHRTLVNLAIMIVGALE